MDDSSDAVNGEVTLEGVHAARRGIPRQSDGTTDTKVDMTAKSGRRLADPPHCHRALLKFPASVYGLPLLTDTGVCDTGGVALTKPLHTTSTEGAVLVDDAVETQKPWNVIVWNDPVTPMSVVVVIFKRIFGYSNNKCTQLMMAVHHEGRALVWSGARDRAESYCVKLQVAGLQSTIELDN